MRANTDQQVHFLSGKSSKLASSTQASDKGMQKAASLGLIRVAGDMFECPSTRDLWRVNGDKVMRVTSAEVDFNEKLKAANEDDPKSFLSSILAQLDF